MKSVRWAVVSLLLFLSGFALVQCTEQKRDPVPVPGATSKPASAAPDVREVRSETAKTAVDGGAQAAQVISLVDTAITGWRRLCATLGPTLTTQPDAQTMEPTLEAAKTSAGQIQGLMARLAKLDARFETVLTKLDNQDAYAANEHARAVAFEINLHRAEEREKIEHEARIKAEANEGRLFRLAVYGIALLLFLAGLGAGFMAVSTANWKWIAAGVMCWFASGLCVWFGEHYRGFAVGCAVAAGVAVLGVMGAAAFYFWKHRKAAEAKAKDLYDAVVDNVNIIERFKSKMDPSTRVREFGDATTVGRIDVKKLQRPATKDIVATIRESGEVDLADPLPSIKEAA